MHPRKNTESLFIQAVSAALIGFHVDGNLVTVTEIADENRVTYGADIAATIDGKTTIFEIRVNCDFDVSTQIVVAAKTIAALTSV